MQIKCEMIKECNSDLAYMDNEGFIYCETHGISRKQWKPCRKLKKREIKDLEAGQRPRKY